MSLLRFCNRVFTSNTALTKHCSFLWTGRPFLIGIMAESGITSIKRCNEEAPIANDSKRLCMTTATGTTDRVKKRKVVLLMGYCGQGYLGMQRNIGYNTIEEELMQAFLKANLINEESFNVMQTLQFQRAARTDKGVSAVRQVVSLKLPETCTIREINEHLPECIRVFAMKRVTKGFNSKSSCDARTYSYMLPTSAFSTSDDMENYRITPEVIEKIKDALSVFTGTHNFHNFTAKKNAQDPSAFRFILKFECDEPTLRDGVEMITLRVKGQSFMLHQIRKMVGTVIAIVRGITTRETISRAWGESRIDLPIAPGLGLVLEEVHYDRYNSKFGNDGVHEQLTWEHVENDVFEFKKKYIDPVIVETEKAEKSMHSWIETLSYHSFDVRAQHVNAAPDAVISKDSKEEDVTETTTNIENGSEVKTSESESIVRTDGDTETPVIRACSVAARKQMAAPKYECKQMRMVRKCKMDASARGAL